MIIIFHAFNAVLELFFWISAPLLRFFFKRIHYQTALRASGTDTQKGMWIHAASVGEVNAVSSLVLELCKHISPSRIFISTTTVNGLKAARSIHPQIAAQLSVLDVSSLRKRQMELINPSLICIVETEIWPNILYWAKRKKIHVLFLNARLSSRSLQRLKLLKPLLKYLQEQIKEIMAKSGEDARRFQELFDLPVSVAGNLKFGLRPQYFEADDIRQAWGFEKDDLIICAGSTRPGEETMLLPIFRALKQEFANLKLIVAPRHPQRVSEVLRLLSQHEHRLYSDMDQNPQGDILILDSLGILNQAYSICDLAIVGGSFYDFGGHNPLEPAYYAKAIVMGEYHSSCLESVQALAAQQAILICDAQSLEQKLRELIQDKDLRQSLGSKAKEVLLQSQNSLQAHLQGVLKWFSTDDSNIKGA